MRVGETVKYLKRGWNRREGRRRKILKEGGGGKLGQGVGALKKRGGEGPPYELWNLKHVGYRLVF